MGKRRTNEDDGIINASTSFLKYYEHLKELSTVMFEWKNLPETVDPRFLEMCLFRNGQALFFKDDELGFLCLNVALNGSFDVYNIPINRRAYASNGYQAWRDKSDSVIIYNNYLHTNSMLAIRAYASRLADLEGAIDVNCKAQKTPVLITCDESERLSIQQMYMKYDGNIPVIFGEKNLRPNSIKSIQTGAPFVADKMYQIKMQIWNEALTDLGISNVSYQKKERLVSDEVVRNMGGTIASRYSRLEMRREACKKINEMFGLDIWCDYREDFRENDDETMFTGDTGDGSEVELVTDIRTK